MSFENVWSAEEVAAGKELIQVMSAKKAAAQLSERFQRQITKSALISKLTRVRYNGPTYCPANTIGCRTTRNGSGKPKNKDYLAMKTKRWTVPSRVPATKLAPLPPRYMPKSTCQFIAGDYDWKKCGIESHGPWCDYHKQLVTLRK